MLDLDLRISQDTDSAWRTSHPRCRSLAVRRSTRHRGPSARPRPARPHDRTTRRNPAARHALH
eukprot:4816761-Pyramimonas_sp.AAC.1